MREPTQTVPTGKFCGRRWRRKILAIKRKLKLMMQLRNTIHNASVSKADP